MSASRVVPRCVCASTMAGITVMPVRSTRVAPAGTSTSAAAPTARNWPLSTANVAFSMTSPLPTMSRAPSYTVTVSGSSAACSGAGPEQADIANRVSSSPAATPGECHSFFSRCIRSSQTSY